MTFKPGKSGKPKGTRNLTTRAVEDLIDEERDALTRKALDMALAGDMRALQLCLDRCA